MERLVGRSPRRRRRIRQPCILMVQPSSGGRPKDVKNAEREVQLDQFGGRVSGRIEGSCPVVVRHVDEPDANRPHTRVCEGHLS